MKVMLSILVCFISISVFANDDYNAGSDYGKSSKQGGIDNIKDFQPKNELPGFTENPEESKKYGGVRQGSSTLASEGVESAGQDEAAGAVIDSLSKNPKPTLSMDAPFIAQGLSVQSGAVDIVSGVNAECSQKVLSKTTFTNRSCERDLDVLASCSRTGTMKVDSHTYYEQQTQTYTGSINHIYHNGKYNQSAFNPIIYNKGTLKEVRVTYKKVYLGVPGGGGLLQLESYANGIRIDDEWSGCWSNSSAGGGGWSEKACHITHKKVGSIASNFIGGSNYIPMYADLLFTYSNLNVPITFGTSLPIVLGYKGYNEDKLNVIVTIVLDVEKTSYTSSVEWNESCSVNKEDYVLVSSECTEPGGERTQLAGTTEVRQYSDCWNWVDTYSLADGDSGTCSSLMSDPACTPVASACSSLVAGKCTHEQVTYQCQSNAEAVGMLCGGDFFCQSGDCAEMDGNKENNFNQAVSSLAALANAASSAQGDVMPIKAFSGRALSCRKTALGFSNCCKDSGWGQGIGLAHCNDEEKELGAAKEKKLVVSLGDKCTKKVFGSCVKKASVYCVFDSKLGRIIQTQGRRDQLGIGFGGAKNPDCRGVTPEELQKIDFSKVDFYDFYQDLNNNKALPTDTNLAERIKQQVSEKMAGKKS